MCVTFQPILRLFLVMISTGACRVRLGIVPSCTYKHRRRRATYLSDYPTPADHSLATVWMVWWLLTRLLIFHVFRFSRFSCFLLLLKIPTASSKQWIPAATAHATIRHDASGLRAARAHVAHLFRRSGGFYRTGLVRFCVQRK